MQTNDHHQSREDRIRRRSSACERAVSCKKIIKLQFTDEVPRQALSDYGAITQHDGMNAVMEIDKHDLQRLSKMMLDRFPILDFTVEDIPVERGIESLYQKDGVRHESLAEV